MPSPKPRDLLHWCRDVLLLAGALAVLICAFFGTLIIAGVIR